MEVTCVSHMGGGGGGSEQVNQQEMKERRANTEGEKRVGGK